MRITTISQAHTVKGQRGNPVDPVDVNEVNEEILLTLLTSTRVNESQREMSTTTSTRGGASTRVNEEWSTRKECQRGMDLLTLNERFSTSHQQIIVNEKPGNVNEERQRGSC